MFVDLGLRERHIHLLYTKKLDVSSFCINCALIVNPRMSFVLLYIIPLNYQCVY